MRAKRKVLSFTQFNLDARLLKAIEKAGYETPTPIQTQAIPVALNGIDLIGTAQTGTGKTAAFALPILQKLLEDKKSPIPGSCRALIVTPTRELAEQIHENIRAYAAGTSLRSVTVYGGVSFGPQEKALRAGVDIVVACPGRLLDHIEQKNITLDRVKFLVIDEADRMFDMGFLPAIKDIIARTPKTRQTMLFSATFPPEVERLTREALRNPERIAVDTGVAAHTVAHALYPVPNHLKTELLMALLKKTDAFSMLVFTRTKHRADRLAKQIQNAGFKVTALHSNRSQNQRLQALGGFKSGKFQVMVATDIAARGLDIETVSHVINYDVPDTTDAYIHRIGRTGRAEREGDAFTIVTPEDNPMVRDIERAIGQSIERRKLDDFNYGLAPAPKAHVPAQPGARTHGPARQPRSGERADGNPARPARPPVPSTFGRRRRPLRRSDLVG